MKSHLATVARRNLHEELRRMTAEQRLAAFLAHCQLMAQLAIAGAASGREVRDPVSPNAR